MTEQVNLNYSLSQNKTQRRWGGGNIKLINTFDFETYAFQEMSKGPI